MGDEERGYLLELLLTKLRYIQAKSSLLEIGSERNSLQIIGMSATMPNLHQLAEWVDAEVYETKFRPVELELCLKVSFDFKNAWQCLYYSDEISVVQKKTSYAKCLASYQAHRPRNSTNWSFILEAEKQIFPCENLGYSIYDGHAHDWAKWQIAGSFQVGKSLDSNGESLT